MSSRARKCLLGGDLRGAGRSRSASFQAWNAAVEAWNAAFQAWNGAVEGWFASLEALGTPRGASYALIQASNRSGDLSRNANRRPNVSFQASNSAFQVERDTLAVPGTCLQARQRPPPRLPVTAVRPIAVPGTSAGPHVGPDTNL
jgi:hypothetical protein